MGMLAEFKKFALRGNVVDMAVGIIIGGAFGGVVNSLVNDVVMPPIGVLTSDVDFKDQGIPIRDEIRNDAGEVVSPAVVLRYGSFLNAVINFLIVAFAVFLLVKAVNRAQEAFDPKKDEVVAPQAPPEEIQLLREIRDALQKA
jgi:large conductance mechanosensitive channel